jgi:hypothetical protein
VPPLRAEAEHIYPHRLTPAVIQIIALTGWRQFCKFITLTGIYFDNIIFNCNLLKNITF